MNVGYFARHVVQYGRPAHPWCRTATLTIRVTCILAQHEPNWPSWAPSSAMSGNSTPRCGSLVPSVSLCGAGVPKIHGKAVKFPQTPHKVESAAHNRRKGVQRRSKTRQGRPNVVQPAPKGSPDGPKGAHPGPRLAHFGGTFGQSRPTPAVLTSLASCAETPGLMKNHEKHLKMAS